MANDTKIKVSFDFDSEKVTATKMYMAGKNLEIEKELTKYFESLYEKHVPNQVKEFIRMKEEGTDKKGSVPLKIRSFAEI